MTKFEVLDRVRELGSEHELLLEQLGCSMLIEELWPEAFEHGTVTGQWVGNQDRMRFTITRGDGSSRTWERDEVPESMRPPMPRRRWS